MKNIEKRAREWGNGIINRLDTSDLERGYIQGATEQKSIDDKKYKRIRELAWNMYSKMMNLNTDLHPLRKSMEEFHHYICFEEEKYEKY